MLFKNYEYFIAIKEEGSVSKAAEKLFISQPSLSKYLKRLEENVGTELFSRDSYPLKLTEAGDLYLEYVKDVVLKEKYLKQDFLDLQNASAGTVSLGITVWRSSIILPMVLPVFKKEYPHIRIEVKEGSHQYMASLLEHDKVDFSIFHLPNSYQNVTFEHLVYEKILFVVNGKNPLLKKISRNNGQVTTMSFNDFQAFKNEPFILLQNGQNIREITQNYLNKLRIRPKILLETSNLVTAINLTSASMGVTFVPEAVLQIKEQHKNLVFFQVDDPPLQWEVGIAYKTGNPPAKHARLFIDCISRCFCETC